MIIAAITASLVAFMIGSVTAGGQHIFSSYALFLAGTIAEFTPRQFLPDRFLWWYDDALMRWEPPQTRKEQ